MANNCLVTKLKGVVDNDNLIKLGEAIFTHLLDHYDENEWFVAFSDLDLTKTAVSDGILYGPQKTNLGQSVVLNNEYFLHMENYGQKSRIQNVYDLTTLKFTDNVSYSGPDFIFLSKLKIVEIYNDNIKIDIKKASFLNTISYFVVNENSISDGILDFSIFPNLRSLAVLGYNNTKSITIPAGLKTFSVSPLSTATATILFDNFLIGDVSSIEEASLGLVRFADTSFSSFLKLTNVKNLRFNGIVTLSGDMSVLGGLVHLTDLGFPNTFNVSCVIEDFVGHARTAGRTSGSIIFGWAGASNTTFQGVRVENKGATTLSWTSNTITYDGVTINA